jgi:hypothetical protein
MNNSNHTDKASRRSIYCAHRRLIGLRRHERPIMNIINQNRERVCLPAVGTGSGCGMGGGLGGGGGGVPGQKEKKNSPPPKAPTPPRPRIHPAPLPVLTGLCHPYWRSRLLKFITSKASETGRTIGGGDNELPPYKFFIVPFYGKDHAYDRQRRAFARGD